MANGKAGAPFGNRNSAKSRPFWNAIEKACAQEDGKRLRRAAEKLLDAAAAGEDWAIKELGDRLDGRPHQTVAMDADMRVTDITHRSK